MDLHYHFQRSSHRCMLQVQRRQLDTLLSNAAHLISVARGSWSSPIPNYTELASRQGDTSVLVLWRLRLPILQAVFHHWEFLHMFTFPFTFIVIASLSSTSLFSHRTHSSDSPLDCLGIWDLLLSSVVAAEADFFLILFNTLVLNKRLQLLWYCGLLRLKVSAIPSPSYNLRWSNLIGNAWSSRNRGIFVARLTYPSFFLLVGWALFLGRSFAIFFLLLLT